MLDYLITPAFQ